MAASHIDLFQEAIRLHREGVPYFALFANAYNHPNAFGHGLFIEEILRCLDA